MGKGSEVEIAVLLTCHNRQQKTTDCMRSLLKAFNVYNNNNMKIHLEIFLVNDGCTDDTVNKVTDIIGESISLHILVGDGNMFWAGGMRYCWEHAMRSHQRWDYYFLLNDDVELKECVFDLIFDAERFCKNKFGQVGIVSGFTCDKNDSQIQTYGGSRIVNRFLATELKLTPCGQPQMCDLANANILLVPASVVDKIGIFYRGYQHGHADYDYAFIARKHGIPVVLTANFCGRCNNDHLSKKDLANRIMSMTLKERKVFFNNPIHSSRDYLRYVSRVAPFRWPLVWVGRILNLYWPRFYYLLHGIRLGKTL